MKFDCYSYTGVEELDTLPILDWLITKPSIQYEHKYGKFTGKYWNYFYFTITLFRRKFVFDITWNYRETSKEEAKVKYHEKRKSRCI